MKRIVFLSLALLIAGQWMRTEANHSSPRSAVAIKLKAQKRAIASRVARYERALDDGAACCVAEVPGRTKVLAGSAAAVACTITGDSGENPFPADTHSAVLPPSSTRGTAYVVGDFKTTPERAREDAEQRLRQAITPWLTPEVPTQWTPPSDLVRRTIVGEPAYRSLARDYLEEPVQQAALKVDLSSDSRAQFIKAYHREQGTKRLAGLGAGLVFLLACLGITSAYIRTDEATKGYYTNRLRLLAAAGFGAAGAALWRYLA
ncbi:MAG: hypothetical protein U0800_25450 [Isosphaeraceae bacterium]